MKKNVSVTSAFLFAMVLITGILLSSCNSAKNLVSIPTPENDYAKQLAATNHLISTDTVAIWIDRYQKNMGDRRAAASAIFYNSEAFNKQLFLLFLSQPGCIGIRVTYGMDENNTVHQIITGVDQNGKDLYIQVNDPKGYFLMKPRGGMPQPPLPNGNYAGEKGLGCPDLCQ